MDVVRINLNIVLLGHEKSGKSATVERLVQKYRGHNKSAHEKSLMSTLLRNKELTNDVDKWEFDTSQYHCKIFDADGNSEFIKNMITATSQADIAVLMIDSTIDEWSAIVEHALFAHILDVKYIICCCNKMDATQKFFSMNRKYSESRFYQIVRTLSDELMIIGYNTDIIPFIPMSALKDENLSSNKSNKLDWYCGPTLVEAIDCIMEPKTFLKKPLRLTLYGARIENENDIVAVGRVESGILTTGMKIIVAPSGATSKVKSVRSLEVGESSTPERVLAGDIVSFTVTRVDPRYLSVGSIASDPKKDPIRMAETFVSEVVVLRSFKGEIKLNDVVILQCNKSRKAVKFKRFYKIDQASGTLLNNASNPLRCGDKALVKMKPSKPIVAEEFKKYPELGCFTINNEGVPIAYGIIKSLKRTEGVKHTKNSLVKSGNWENCISHVAPMVLTELFTCLFCNGNCNVIQ